VITSLLGKQKSVSVDTDGPVVIIGEKINPTGNKKLATALQEQDFEYIQQLAFAQVVAGADILDINVGVPGLDEIDLLPKVVELIAEVSDAPICLDSPNSDALAAALSVVPGKPLVNSVSGENSRLETILPLVKDYRAAVIGLTMDDNGIPLIPKAAYLLPKISSKRLPGSAFQPKTSSSIPWL
jgi:5-methyltetrahydrofolate--homocysteine methyltransferase